MLEGIRESLERFGVEFDCWYSERSLYENGLYDEAIGILRDKGYLSEREGALWFTSSELGESKDNVVVRSDGRPTYFASDIAYHYGKFRKRGFDDVIDIWGADHHGHVSRMKTAAEAVGIDADRLRILIYQLVTIRREGQEVRVSKRAGNLITLDDLVAEVGRDAARFFFVQRSLGAHMDFDLDLAMKQSNENPVYYVQYAHARLSSILERAAEEGLTPDAGDVSLLTQPHELALVREMMRLPDVIAHIAETLEPHELPQYAVSLATAFTAFNDAPRQQNDASLRVIVEDAAVAQARLRLVLATKIALARVLDLMGMSAPERM
jgi:arginyl-tRNA synthetase